MSEPRPERRLAAILATDVAGYSRLMNTNEEATLARLNTLQKAVMEPAIEEFRGRIVKTMGDGILAEFASAVDAVRAAVKIQRGTRSFNAEIPEPEQLRLRIGVNIGDLIYQGADVFGDGVNIAARLQSIAELDGIFVSQTVRDYVREEASFIFDDLGARSLKNIDRPVRVFRVRPTGDGPAGSRRAGGSRRLALVFGGVFVVAAIAAGAGWWYLHDRGPRPRAAITASTPAAPNVSPVTPSAPAPPSVTAAPQTPTVAPTAQPGTVPAPSAPLALPAEPRFSLVVLPLRNPGGDVKDRYFSDILSDRIIAALGRLPGGLVIARGTGFAYRGRASEAKAVTTELKVRYLLEGSAGREGKLVHVTARLLDGETGATAWQGTFDKESSALATLEGELIAGLGNALGADAAGIQQASAALAPVANAEADDLAMQGWELAYRQPTLENSNEAEALFAKALAADADNREAKLGLAFTLLRGFAVRQVTERRARVRRADEAVSPVFEQNPDVPLARLLKAEVLLQSAQPDRALQILTEALALNPSMAECWALLGLVENRLGREADSLPHLRYAIRLSPRDPFLGLWLTGLGASELATGDETPALADLNKATIANTRFATPYLWIAAIEARQGNLPAAQAALAEYDKREPGMTIAHLRQPGAISVHVPDIVVDGLRKAGMKEQ